MIGYLIQHGHAFLIDMLRLVVWLAVLAIIFVPLERLFALHPRGLWRPQIGADLGYYFVNGFVPAIIMSVVLGPVIWAVHRFIPPGFHAAVAAQPLWVRILAGLVIGDFGYYWAHRALHAVPMLWRFHAVHHSAPRIDFLVSTRAHPVDMVIGRLSGVIPLYVLGLAGPAGAAPSTMPVLLVLIGTSWGFFIHANVKWRFGPLAWVLSTPHFHHWHHTMEAPLSRNYASMLPWLDRLFGTLHVPERQWPAVYGIPDPMPEAFGEQLLQPFLEQRPAPAE